MCLALTASKAIHARSDIYQLLTQPRYCQRVCLRPWLVSSRASLHARSCCVDCGHIPHTFDSCLRSRSTMCTTTLSHCSPEHCPMLYPMMAICTHCNSRDRRRICTRCQRLQAGALSDGHRAALHAAPRTREQRLAAETYTLWHGSCKLSSPPVVGLAIGKQWLHVSSHVSTLASNPTHSLRHIA